GQKCRNRSTRSAVVDTAVFAEDDGISKAKPVLAQTAGDVPSMNIWAVPGVEFRLGAGARGIELAERISVERLLQVRAVNEQAGRNMHQAGRSLPLAGVRILRRGVVVGNLNDQRSSGRLTDSAIAGGCRIDLVGAHRVRHRRSKTEPTGLA